MLPLTDGLTGKKVSEQLGEATEAPSSVPANDHPVKLLSGVNILFIKSISYILISITYKLQLKLKERRLV